MKIEPVNESAISQLEECLSAVELFDEPHSRMDTTCDITKLVESNTPPEENNSKQNVADLYMPIGALSYTSTDWTIKVRVTRKGKLTKWNNSKSSG